MKRKMKSEFLEAEIFNLKKNTLLGMEPVWCGHLLQSDIHPCPGGAVGQVELPYLEQTHMEGVALVRAT